MAVPSEFFEEISSEHMKDFQFIDRGAFGDIYRVRHQEWGIDVAVKILNRDTSITQELRDEARAMHKARFRYVLHLYGLYVGKVPPDSFGVGLVMEYMENGSLSTLREWVGGVPWALRFRILHQVALAMNFLHSLSPPLLHLDLKPSNVLLDGELSVKVADFGLSKFKRGYTRSSSQTNKEGEEYGGTLEYLPPEAFDFKYKPTPGTDVYSKLPTYSELSALTKGSCEECYGILMWSVLASQEPYPYLPPANRSSLIRHHIPQGQRPCTESLERIRSVSNLEDMIKLMKRCWDNEKTKRPSFRECKQETEKASSSHKPHITAAVRQVQDILAQKNSSFLKKTGLSSVQDTKKASLSPPRSEKLVQQQYLQAPSFEEQFATVHITGYPSGQNEAAPSETSSKQNSEGKPSAPPLLQRSQSAYDNQGMEAAGFENHSHPQANVQTRLKPEGRKPRPFSDTYLFPPSMPYPSGYPPYQPIYGSSVNARAFHSNHSLLPQFHPVSSYSGIHIHGHNMKGVQIGNNNTMHIEKGHEENNGKKH